MKRNTEWQTKKKRDKRCANTCDRATNTQILELPIILPWRPTEAQYSHKPDGMCQNGNRDRQSIMNHSHATKGCSHFYSCHARSAPPTSAPLTHPTSPQQAPTCTHKTYECQVQGYLTTACSGRAHEIKQRYRTTKNEQITARCTTHARGASRAMSRLVRALKSSELSLIHI